MNPIERLLKGDDADFFKTADLDVFNCTNEYGHSVLRVAAENGRLRCCQVIYQKCPKFLYQTDRSGVSPLHRAAYNGREDIVEFLLYAQARTQRDHGTGEEDYVGSGRTGEQIADSKLLMMVNRWNNTALHDAVTKGHFKSAELLVEADTSNALLRMVNYQKNTALHIAVEKNNLEMVKLLVKKDSDLDYSANYTGHTPHLMALEAATKGDPGAVQIRKLLIKRLPNQCQVRIGENGWTLLHHAAFKGDLDAIEEILEYCPSCLELVDNEGQNFIHIAARYGHEHVVTHIVRSTNLSEKVLNWQDKDGNTPLHLATLRGNVGLAHPLLYDSRVNVKILNNQGQSPLEAITFDYDKRSALYGFTNRVDEKEMKNRSDFDLLVGALICTVSFTAGITLPGGFITEGQRIGTAILYEKPSFELFMISNAIAFALSLYAVFSHFSMKHLEEEKYVIYQLKLSSFCSLGAIFALMVAFISGSFAVLAVSPRVSNTICAICSVFFIVASHPMWTMVRQLRQRQLAGDASENQRVSPTASSHAEIRKRTCV